MSSASDWGATSPSRSVTTSSRPDRATAIGTDPAQGRDCGSLSWRYFPGTLSAPSSQPSSRRTNVFSRVLLTGRVSTSSRTCSITSGRKTGSSPSTSAVGYPAPSSTL